ncbi:aldose 1-epimerase [Brevundimonas alba]|uniref:Aldose 1-epimerase n=1 Tax=Brevundimonas alba TaxID=74314 RepID=A0A7X5YJY4_9CAUL|nr:aldose 1-epimerase [Brevundimonas alba]
MTPSGEAVEAVTLTNAAGVRVRILNLGAAIQSVIVPDREGRMADVALGFSSLEECLASTAYMGVTVGRVANRVARGRFVLDGQTYEVPTNDGPNSLHGGAEGLDRRTWDIVEVRDGDEPGVTLRCVSPDGDQGYPGELTVTAAFSLRAGGVLAIDYTATTDRPTVVNVTSHAYWNMAGEGAPEGAMGNRLTLFADEFLPTDATAIPTGEFRSVEGTPFDFRAPTPVGLRVREAGDEQIAIGRGYDHNWVVSREPAAEPRVIAVLEDPVSGRVMELSSDQPGVQMYSGNFLDGTVAGKSGRLYRQGDAVVLEPQMFPDTPNQPAFGSIRLEPGQVYRNRIRFRFFTR